MSGGSMDYVYSSLAMALNIPSGSYGIGNGKRSSYNDDVKDTRRLNPMHDAELSEMMYDVSCLLNSLEWYESGDIGEEQYLADVSTFKSKWFNRDSKQSTEAYKSDILSFLDSIAATLKDSPEVRE